MATSELYPFYSKEDLTKKFVSKSIKDVTLPAAVIDRQKVKRNCDRMLDACEELKFRWRAHIKTHKTTELTKLQVGDGNGPANLIVSTIIEAENVAPLLLEYKAAGRAVNVLYSFPVTPGAVERLSQLNKSLGQNGLSLMVDHPTQLESVIAIHKATSIAPSIFLKIDMGGRRAGVVPETEACSQLITSILSLEKAGQAIFLGLYSHAGHSYSSNSQDSALDYLRLEFESLLTTLSTVHAQSPSKQLILSVGATPTTTSIRNLLLPNTPETPAITALKKTISQIQSQNALIEIHAGVYPLLDCQQLATNALPTTGPNAQLTFNDIAFTIIAEVASLYPSRGTDGTAEALLGAGSLALGREPCKAYSGWGILTPWNRVGVSMPSVPLEEYKGWKVGRISQEHGILTWDGEKGEEEPLEVGMKVRVWPNHACIAGRGFDWYFVVDGGREGREDEIVDVWPRWRGW
ncbi:PLP-binding barrel [Glarea lozoyensis ATCC 20868]|uniref:D-serine dehydratase n=1 Tax=Glarea lozoyensis (strain ATCC 20868 / MF5171) TaxID=1116229 RepID=S3CDY2_GLAL2|nr:PLP-binding barrel [Glarea lozoyensis ATCC 20868]EPE24722.1 PLP-binding barrel [Glarea lozoyensis ATCC 20868]